MISDPLDDDDEKRRPPTIDPNLLEQTREEMEDFRELAEGGNSAGSEGNEASAEIDCPDVGDL